MEFAGRTVLVKSPEARVEVIKIATTISASPSERWLHGPGQQQRLDRVLAHALLQPGEASEVNSVAERLGF